MIGEFRSASGPRKRRFARGARIRKAVLVGGLVLVLLLPLIAYAAYRGGYLKEWGGGKHLRKKGARADEWLRPCVAATKVFAVGGCEPLFEIRRPCGGHPTQPVADEYAALVQHMAKRFPGKAAVREVVEPNGAKVSWGTPMPAELHALMDRDLYVLPCCKTGNVISVPSPSANKTFQVRVASTEPRVLTVDGFLSPSECEVLINRARDHVERSLVSAEGKTITNKHEESRTSSTAWLDYHKNTMAKTLRVRVGELVGIGDFDEYPHVITEDLQVLRYKKKEHYHTHHDYFDPVKHNAFLQNDGRNRFITVLFYLNDVHDGGETVFPLAGDMRAIASWSDCDRGLKVKPRLGSAVIFYSLLPDGQQSGGLDESSYHGSCDVTDGTKWAANYWITLKGVHPLSLTPEP